MRRFQDYCILTPVQAKVGGVDPPLEDDGSLFVAKTDDANYEYDLNFVSGIVTKPISLRPKSKPKTSNRPNFVSLILNLG